jgi:peptidoglycan/LPS O-acetylase OafA/YrhL
MRDFLISLGLLLLLVGLSMAIVWLRSKRQLPIVTSYYRAVLLIMRFGALGIMAIAGFILILAITDQLGFTHFGYPAVAVVVLVPSLVVVYGVQHFISKLLRSPEYSK